MDPDSIRQYAAMLCFLGLACFFSAAETSLTASNKLKIRNLASEGDKRAILIEKVTSSSGKLLSSILIGNNICNTALTAIATAVVLANFPSSEIALTVSTVLVTVLILIFAEITPKTISARYPEKVALALVRPASVFYYALTPVVIVLDIISGWFVKLFGGGEQGVTVTESEIKTMVDVSHKEGVIETEEKDMINNVFEFGDYSAKEIMTPRVDIVAAPLTATYAEVLAIFKEERFSRVLVYGDDLDDIQGVLSFKDFVFSGTEDGGFDVVSLLRKPFYSYEAKNVSELFREMREQTIAIAVILDEYAGTSGIITIEDLVEVIVGDIYDEDDEDEDEYTLIQKNEYLVDGSMKLEDFNETWETEFESDDYETFGGYVMGELGHIPQEGEQHTLDGMDITIEKMDKIRIDKLRVVITRAEADA